MQQPIHILTQMGILTSFSISKRVSEKDIGEFFKKNKKHGKSKAEAGELLREKIINEIQTALINNKIPGLISPPEIAEETGGLKNIKKMFEINRITDVIHKKILTKKYDKTSLCYFINSMVNLFELTEKDFEEFHRLLSDKPDNDEYDDTEDDTE